MLKCARSGRRPGRPAPVPAGPAPAAIARALYVEAYRRMGGTFVDEQRVEAQEEVEAAQYQAQFGQADLDAVKLVVGERFGFGGNGAAYGWTAGA